jgi:DNA-binding ferritin-like protein
MTEQLNTLLADTMPLRDLYKKSHWQVAGPTFYQLHLLYDKHFGEQAELVDVIAERIQLLRGVSIARGGDVAETTQIERPRLADAKRFRFNNPGCWMPTRSLLVSALRWRAAPPLWAMTERTI